MKNRLPVYFAFIFFISTGVAASDYLPWQKGDHASYTHSLTNAETKTEIERSSGKWAQYTNFAGLGALWVRTSKNSEVVHIFAPSSRDVQRLVDFNAPVGTAWPADIAPCNKGTVTLASKGEELNTPAGNFSDVIRLDLQPSCADGGVTHIWFAKGIGPVQWRETTIAGEITYSMSAGTIAGTQYPRPSGIIVSAEFPPPKVYVEHDLVNLPPPQTVSVFMTIQNNTSQDLVYQFATGQQFEITLTDPSGKVVTRWSHDKAFITSPTTLTIPPGKAVRFGGSIKLAPDDGSLPYLPVQDYLLTIDLVGRPPRSSTILKLDMLGFGVNSAR